MKLYNVPLSPFAARCRIQIYAKKLPIELVDPPGGLGSESYRRLNPTGKVPALQLDDGFVLPESAVIGEYLEDRFPEPALRPIRSMLPNLGGIDVSPVILIIGLLFLKQFIFWVYIKLFV